MVSSNTIIRRCPSFNRNNAYTPANQLTDAARQHRRNGCSLDANDRNASGNWTASFGDQRHFQTPGYRNYTNAADCGQYANNNLTNWNHQNVSIHPQTHQPSTYAAANPSGMNPLHGLIAPQLATTQVPPGANVMGYVNTNTQGYHYAKIHRHDDGGFSHLSHTDANVDTTRRAPGGTFRVHTPEGFSVIAQHGSQPAERLDRPADFGNYSENMHGRDQGLYYFSR